MVAIPELLAPHGADFTIDLDLLLLNQLLGLAAGVDHIGIFQRILQLDKFRVDLQRGSIVLFLNDYFHIIAPIVGADAHIRPLVNVAVPQRVDVGIDPYEGVIRNS